ncbi:hypothetical protein [Dysgonomonas sp. Marseille-P4677]|uniref:hypothetical protein n=1 Tax=Dysgonomonas sp. Marseille-P4677 TaxID=2364790 RepID=UPI001F3EE678|nr:hypothetical protein [Dysgonomonas sp. Marseille-P4677]
MNDLLRMKFFSLLSESSQVTTDEMKNTYENFVNEVKNLNQSDRNYATVYRTLSLTRIELTSLSKQFRYEQGEKYT